MDYRKFDETYDKLCKELEKQMDKDLSAGTLSTMHQLAGTMHYIDELMKSDEGDEYSERSYRDGYRSYRGGRSYDDGRSYEDGRSMRRGQRRDSMGRYSREYSRGGDFREQMEEMMESAPDQRTRDAMRQMLENMK